MRLGWNRGDDGVITVYAHTTDNRVADVADFWLRPLMEKFGASRVSALYYQQQFAELLVSAHNRIFTKPLGSPEDDKAVKVDRREEGSTCLRIANDIREEVNEILARYDVPSNVYELDIAIDAFCVRLADDILGEQQGCGLPISLGVDGFATRVPPRPSIDSDREKPNPNCSRGQYR